MTTLMDRVRHFLIDYELGEESPAEARRLLELTERQKDGRQDKPEQGRGCGEGVDGAFERETWA